MDFPFFSPSSLSSPRPPSASPSFIIAWCMAAYIAHLHLLRLYQNGHPKQVLRSHSLEAHQQFFLRGPSDGALHQPPVEWRIFVRALQIIAFYSGNSYSQCLTPLLCKLVSPFPSLPYSLYFPPLPLLSIPAPSPGIQSFTCICGQLWL